MFCPACREEYSWDVMICPACDVETVDRLPGPEPTPDVELAPVFAAGSAALVAIAKSLLEGEKIEYMVRGETVQNLVGIGQSTGFSYAMGPVEFWVREDDAARARMLLADLRTDSQQDDEAG